jgi:hypothetical protein
MYSYITNAMGVYYSNNVIFLADSIYGLLFVNVSDPLNLTEIGRCSDAGSVRAVHISDNLAFVADYMDGLEIIDISNLESTRIVGKYRSRRKTVDVHVSGNIVYLIDEIGLDIIEITKDFGDNYHRQQLNEKMVPIYTFITAFSIISTVVVIYIYISKKDF